MTAPDTIPAVQGVTADHPWSGWLFFNPDTGTELSENHPVRSGECDDAEDIRPATKRALRDELVSAWRALAEAERDVTQARDQSAGWRANADQWKARASDAEHRVVTLEAAAQVRAGQDGEVERLRKRVAELEDDVRSYSNWCVERENEGFRRGEEAGREDAQSVADSLKAKLGAAQEANERLRSVVRKVEWVDDAAGREFCPGCGRYRQFEHHPDCGLAALLADPATDTGGAGAAATSPTRQAGTTGGSHGT